MLCCDTCLLRRSGSPVCLVFFFQCGRSARRAHQMRGFHAAERLLSFQATLLLRSANSQPLESWRHCVFGVPHRGTSKSFHNFAVSFRSLRSLGSANSRQNNHSANICISLCPPFSHFPQKRFRFSLPCGRSVKNPLF
jgi:hypothetical protein